MKLAALALALAACSSTARSSTTPRSSDDSGAAKVIIIGALAIATIYLVSQAVDTNQYKPNQ